MGLIKYSKSEIKQVLSGGASDYTPELCLELLDHMSEGHSVNSFCGKFLLTMGMIKGWAKRHPDFSQALEIGKNLQRYQWETILLEQAKGEIKANPAAMIFALKNFFPEDFQDKREIAVTAAQIIIDTGIGHRNNNHLEEAQVVEKVQIEGPIDFDDLELEEEENRGFTQDIESMYSSEESEEDTLDFL